ncbi:desiccation-related protein pcc13-62 [Quercus suber]|uniref:Desiccation-related protein pcc13-62 n=1 Tax=Quercus suber TaxID=58331 RepID=A0AAW0L7F4_QUESU
MLSYNLLTRSWTLEFTSLLASYLIPYVGLTGYVGTIPKLKAPVLEGLFAGLLGVESGQDAVIRAYLYEHAKEIVSPYGITVGEFTNRFSELRDRLGHQGHKMKACGSSS